MKKKVFKKRLVLNKTTVADLDLGGMNAVIGGDSGDILCGEKTRTCQACPTEVYNCTTADPGRICLNTCDCPETTVVICRYTDCC